MPFQDTKRTYLEAMLPRPDTIAAHAVMTAILDQVILKGRIDPEPAHDGALGAK
jgi:hypothetical protein